MSSGRHSAYSKEVDTRWNYKFYKPCPTHTVIMFQVPIWQSRGQLMDPGVVSDSQMNTHVLKTLQSRLLLISSLVWRRRFWGIFPMC